MRSKDGPVFLHELIATLAKGEWRVPIMDLALYPGAGLDSVRLVPDFFCISLAGLSGLRFK